MILRTLCDMFLRTLCDGFLRTLCDMFLRTLCDWVFENIVVGYSADIVQTLLTGLLCDTVRLCSPVYFGRLFCLGRRVPCQPPYVDPATDPAHANTTLALCSVK